MVRNKKAMSQIVTTVILVVLVLVAIGIVWGVISNLIGDSSDDIDIGAKCLGITVNAVAVNNTATTDYDVTLERNSESGDIGGVKVVLSSDSNSSAVLDAGVALTPLQKQRISFATTGLEGANSAKITVFFVDGSGNENLCPVSTEYTF